MADRNRGWPSEQAIRRVSVDFPKWNRQQVLDYIAAAHRGNLICLDCGSENHTRGHALCPRPCEACDGGGTVPLYVPDDQGNEWGYCPVCKGTGRVA